MTPAAAEAKTVGKDIIFIIIISLFFIFCCCCVHEQGKGCERLLQHGEWPSFVCVRLVNGFRAFLVLPSMSSGRTSNETTNNVNNVEMYVLCVV